MNTETVQILITLFGGLALFIFGMNFMSAAEFSRQMKELVENNTYISNGVEKELDSEKFHKQADGLLCKALRSLGYDVGVNIFEKYPKHYSKGDWL